MKRAMIVAAAAFLTLTACSGDKGPTKEDGVKVLEGFFTEQGRQATLQGSWRFEVTDAGDLSLKCEKKPNGDHACDVSGTVTALGHLGGQPTSQEGKNMKVKMHVTFRPQGEGWQAVEVKDEGTSAG
ncbi:hypothetical protein ACULMH_13320 [Xanthomonas arboricola pv. corylina]|uniref:hypothetical protein n=1 Tax=Xanthomonas arboricola TaxID=56448 RepID=UPI00404085A3